VKGGTAPAAWSCLRGEVNVLDGEGAGGTGCTEEDNPALALLLRASPCAPSIWKSSSSLD
jgi:hypothetical protein